MTQAACFFWSQTSFQTEILCNFPTNTNHGQKERVSKELVGIQFCTESGAASVFGLGQDICQEFQGERQVEGQAQLAINSASAGMKSAQAWIGRANGIVSNATALGMDTKDQVAKVATARGLLENSQSYLQDANDQYRSKDYAQAKTSAAKAQNNSDEAEGKAKEKFEANKLSQMKLAYDEKHED